MYQDDPTQYATLGIDKVRTELRFIPIELLRPGTWQQRKYFNPQALEELGRSMQTSGGNVTPVVVTPNQNGGYSIISGERRWRAGQLIMLDTLKCIAGDYNFEQASFIAAVENLQREDLNPIEEATSYQSMKLHSQLSDEQIANEIGKSRPHVSNYIRLLSLDIQVRDALIRGTLSSSHARPLCSLDKLFQQRSIAEMAIKKSWSVKRISAEVAAILEKPKLRVKLSDGDADLRRLERDISDATGNPCVVRKSPNGQWQLGFLASGNDQFVGLLERLGIETDMDL